MAYDTVDTRLFDPVKAFDLLCDRKWREYHAFDTKRDFPCKHGHFNCSTREGGPCCDEQHANLVDNYGPDPDEV